MASSTSYPLHPSSAFPLSPSSPHLTRPNLRSPPSPQEKPRSFSESHLFSGANTILQYLRPILDIGNHSPSLIPRHQLLTKTAPSCPWCYHLKLSPGFATNQFSGDVWKINFPVCPWLIFQNLIWSLLWYLFSGRKWKIRQKKLAEVKLLMGNIF